MTQAITEQIVSTQLDKLAALRDAIARVIVGQREVVEQLLIGLIAGGHCLLEGVPGLGKTLLVRSLGQALALYFKLLLFTTFIMQFYILGTLMLVE
jgi:MoxR-like ATPase